MMRYSYDWHGFLSDTPIPDRSTDVVPPDASGWPAGQRPNWTGHAWTYLDYPPPPPPPAPRRIAVADFRARFTDAEMAAIVSLAYSGAGDVTAAMLLLKIQTSNEIDLTAPEVTAGMAYLIARGCLAACRAAEILG